MGRSEKGIAVRKLLVLLFVSLGLVVAGCSSSDSSSSAPPSASESATETATSSFSFPTVSGYELSSSPVWTGVEVRTVNKSDGSDLGGMQVWQFAPGDDEGVKQRIIDRDTVNAYDGNGKKAQKLTLGGTDWYVTASNNGESLRFARYDKDADSMLYVTAKSENQDAMEQFLKAFDEAVSSASPSADSTFSFPTVSGYEIAESPVWAGVELVSVNTPDGTDMGGMQAWSFAPGDDEGVKQRIIDRDTVNSYGGDGQAAEKLTLGGADWYLTSSNNGESIRFASYDENANAMLYIATKSENQDAVEKFIEAFEGAEGGSSASTS